MNLTTLAALVPSSVKVSAPTVPWAALAVCGLIALVGMALWKTTVGKAMIVAGVTVALYTVVNAHR